MVTETGKQIKPIHRLASLAQELLCQRIAAGDVVMDATMGNGHDTLFLWERVGPTGRVFSFDVQSHAIISTKALLFDHGWEESDTSVSLILDNHGCFTRYISQPIKVAMFNLGYLPGSDKNISTSWPEVNSVLDQLINQYLKAGGYISIISYSGHAEGKSEQVKLLDYVRKLPSKSWGVMEITRSNASQSAPKLILIEKKA